MCLFVGIILNINIIYILLFHSWDFHHCVILLFSFITDNTCLLSCKKGSKKVAFSLFKKTKKFKSMHMIKSIACFSFDHDWKSKFIRGFYTEKNSRYIGKKVYVFFDKNMNFA